MKRNEVNRTKKNQNGSIACYCFNRICRRWALFPRGSFARRHFWPGGLLSGGLMPVPPKFNAYTHRLGFLCVELQRDGQTNKKQTNKQKRQTRPCSSAGSRPTLPKFSGYVEVEALHISSKHCMGPTPFYGARAEKTPFCHKANEYMSPQQRHNQNLYNRLLGQARRSTYPVVVVVVALVVVTVAVLVVVGATALVRLTSVIKS